MCGIWTYTGKESRLGTLVSMRHRGPDDYDTKSFITPVGLLEMASWRLSILDLSPLGRMPMSYADGRYWVVYNGEIYNYRELRADLEARGHRFRSESDTEVLLAAYAQWGESCLQRFNGMFAFCLWDDASRKLFVARDRFGVKPIYYHNSPNGLAFASEIKQFWGLPYFQARMNLQPAFEFLSWGFLDHTNETLFKDVYQLQGGEYMLIPLATWHPGQPLPIRRWYTLERKKLFRGSFEESAEQYRELLTDSVRLRLRADVPVGSCLSGGMDSSAIVCTASKLLAGSRATEFQKTFSSCFDMEKYDERKFIQEVVSHTNVDAHYIFPRETELFSILDRLVWHQDEPFNSTSIFAQWTIFERAQASRAMVMLDGQGGDEQLGSYSQFFGPHIFGLISRLRIPVALREAHCFKKLHGWKYDAFFQTLAASYSSLWVYRLMRKAMNKPDIPLWLNAKFLCSMGVEPSKPLQLIQKATGTTQSYELSKMMITNTTLPMLLHWEDRNSMAHSVEARVPFLDYRLVEFALSLPDEYKTRDGITKIVLKCATEGLVPEKIRARTDKMGFVTPEEVWLKSDSGGQFKAALLQATRTFPDLFRSAELEKEFEEVVRGVRAFSHIFWRVITLGVWGRVFKVGI